MMTATTNALAAATRPTGPVTAGIRSTDVLPGTSAGADAAGAAGDEAASGLRPSAASTPKGTNGAIRTRMVSSMETISEKAARHFSQVSRWSSTRARGARPSALRM